MTAGKRNRRGQRSTNDDNRYTVRGVRRDPVDIPKLSKALIGLAVAEAEREAQADHKARASQSEDTSKGVAPQEGEADA
jgi:hypothetical protein